MPEVNSPLLTTKGKQITVNLKQMYFSGHIQYPLSLQCGPVVFFLFVHILFVFYCFSELEIHFLLTS